MEFNIHLIRHAKTKAMEKDLYCGRTDLSITERGKKEIVELMKTNLYPKGDIFFITEMVRTLETLHLIYGDVDYKVLQNFNEQDLGSLDMKSFESIKNIPTCKKWLLDVTGDVKCPGGGESANAFEMRVKLGLYTLLGQTKDAGQQNAVVITHGSVIAVIMNSLYPGRKTLKQWQPDAGRGYMLKYFGQWFSGYEGI